VGLHALGASRRTLRLVLIYAVIYLTFTLGGAAVGGAVGTVWGAAVAPWCTGFYGWQQLFVALRKSGKVPVGHRYWSS